MAEFAGIDWNRYINGGKLTEKEQAPSPNPALAKEQKNKLLSMAIVSTNTAPVPIKPDPATSPQLVSELAEAEKLREMIAGKDKEIEMLLEKQAEQEKTIKTLEAALANVSTSPTAEIALDMLTAALLKTAEAKQKSFKRLEDAFILAAKDNIGFLHGQVLYFFFSILFLLTSCSN